MQINQKREKGTMRRMLQYLKPYRKTLIFCLLLVLLVTALELYKPVLIGNAIDSCITGDYVPGENADQRFHLLLQMSARYILVLIALFFGNRFQHIMMQETGQKIIYDLRNDLFAHTEGLSLRFFDTTPVGKIVTRITNDAESINDVFSEILVNLFKNSIKILSLAVLMLTINLRMALWSFVTLPLAAILTVLFRLISRRAFRITKNKLTELNTFLSEHLSGMRIIHIFAQEERKFAEFEHKNEELFKAGFREMLVNALFRPATYLVSIAATVIVILKGSQYTLSGIITLGTLYIFLQYISSFFNPIQELAEQFAALQSAVASAEKIFTLFDEKALITEKEKPYTPNHIHGRIDFDHVWFAYQGEEWILRDVSFTILPGQKVAFVGATGAGKSSILNLIGRYYDVQRGSVKVDGVDVKDWSLSSLRAAIGQVQQDVFLFSGDVNRNIRLLDDNISDEAIKKASISVNASRFIDHLPNAYQEEVGERGSSLSSGQRQLLSFARVLARNPEILILDEATANIDTETELWIQEALTPLTEGRTSILVAHRLSTIQHADRIMVMHHGKIRESGTHQELLELNGIYHKLYLLQLSKHTD